MSDISTGILQRDLDALDQLDDDAFRDIVARRIETGPNNKRLWKMLYNPALIERTTGCLEELAEELHEAISSRNLPATHNKVHRLAIIDKRLEDAASIAARAAGHVTTMNDEVEYFRTLTRQLALAVDAHRRSCIAENLSPEAHDIALWESLEELRLPARNRDQGPSLAEQIANGYWYHEGAVSGPDSGTRAEP